MPDVMLFYGEEDFLIDEEIRVLRSRFNSDLAFERIDGSAVNTDRLINSITSLPMLAGEKLVVVDDLECGEEDEEKVLNAVGSLDGRVSVLFVYHGGIDRRKRFFKRIESIGNAREFRRMTEWEADKAMEWVIARAKKYGKNIDGRAAEMLVEVAGLNLRMLDKELEKIAVFIGERASIAENDVANMASRGEMNAFELSNAMRDNDAPKAMRLVEELFRDGEDALMMIGMLARLYRMMLQVKCLEGKGRSQNEIAGVLRSKPFFVKKCMDRTHLYTVERLAGNIRALHEADMKIKTGYSPRLTIEMLVPELISGK